MCNGLSDTGSKVGRLCIAENMAILVSVFNDQQM